MSKITLKEIPVQILLLQIGDVLVLRCPPKWDDEQRYGLRDIVQRSLDEVGKTNSICVIGKDIDLATVTNIVKVHEANKK
jgi:hypothetical protein